ncbi:MAG: diphthamide biosynthesis enzyme Dph2 [Candidatus Aenigmarchaeota archaeon]|nr:diphthamide biosynthesis enzyme Dph2 [Candidatus Aenigmarchaeota archaeon]
MLEGFEELVLEIKKRDVKRLFIQVPEGLKTRIQELANSFEGQGIVVVISCEPMWGACDIRFHEAGDLGCDAILNIGHTDFGVKSPIPIFYWPFRLDFDPIPVLESSWKKIERFKSFSLVSTTQHIECLDVIKVFLEKKGKVVLLGKPAISKTHGQILGCDQAAALDEKADCILFVGSGRFHPLGIIRKTEKPVFVLSTDTNSIEDFSKERERFYRIKFAQIEKAKDGKNFGIVVSSKPGQMYIKQAEVLKNKLEGMGKKAWILVMDFITKEKLMGLKLDVLVNCACPRLDEDAHLFGMPVLNPEDVGKLSEVVVL